MGRGRQKAKQTKVARGLKYSSSSLDTLALERELAGLPVNPPVEDDEDDEDDPYAAYADAYDDDSDEDEPDDGYSSGSSGR